MIIHLKEKQAWLLEQLKAMHAIKVLKLKTSDRVLISKVLTERAYLISEKPDLERMRKRWYEARPDATSDEFY